MSPSNGSAVFTVGFSVRRNKTSNQAFPAELCELLHDCYPLFFFHFPFCFKDTVERAFMFISPLSLFEPYALSNRVHYVHCPGFGFGDVQTGPNEIHQPGERG